MFIERKPAHTNPSAATSTLEWTPRGVRAARDGKEVSCLVTNNFDIPAAERRVYVFDSSDLKQTRLPLIGVYDLA